MAWFEHAPSGNYFICFRLGEKRFRRSLKTENEKDARSSVERIAENLRLIERGRLVIPSDADVVTFLLSDGRVSGPPVIVEQITLKGLFDAYFKALPAGSLEETTIDGMKTHQKHLEQFLRPSFPMRTLSLKHLQEFIGERATQVQAPTIRKEVVTLRTVWNWGARSELVEGPFPGRNLRYPKSKEKPPFMSFAEVEELTKGMNEKDAAELWECVYLTIEDLEELLKHVENAHLTFVYPMFAFASHTGARRSEIRRAKVHDVDLKRGWITLHERKKAHDKKTTRRVPISATLHAVLAKWLANHPGGDALFCHAAVVSRSRKRSETTGHAWKDRPTSLRARLATIVPRLDRPEAGELTRDEIHDHFKRALVGTRWAKLKGWHVLRHSFISCLAAKGVDQRIIDDFSGHQTEEQRRRYRHLFPNVTKQAIANVFG